MDLSNRNIGYGITGSFCTFAKTRKEIQRLTEMGAHVIPIFSYQTQNCDTRFGTAKEFINININHFDVIKLDAVQVRGDVKLALSFLSKELKRYKAEYTKKYLEEHLNKDIFFFIEIIDNKIIATCGLQVIKYMPQCVESGVEGIEGKF